MDITEIKVMHLQPGDTLVLKTDLALSVSQREAAMKQLELLVPEGVKAVVLDKGLSLEVLRGEE